MWSGLTTPIKNKNLRLQRARRFVRKPGSDKLERSSSRKSIDSDRSINLRDMYIKSPSSIKKQQNQKNFFESFASEAISHTKRSRINPEQIVYTEGQYIQSQITHSKTLKSKIDTLQSEIDLKNQELSILSGQCEKTRIELQNEKKRVHKIQQQRKQISKQLKETIKAFEQQKIKFKKIQKQKQYLLKQVEFLQQINYDQNTRQLQSYKEKFLQDQLIQIKKQLKKSKQGKEQQLQAQIKKIQEEKYTIQSHYKAMKIANECLIKQLNHNSNSIHQIILNSEQYIKLRQKYIKFLDQYKNLRNQYWALKTQLLNPKNDGQGSSLFNITSSDADGSLRERSLDASNSFNY